MPIKAKTIHATDTSNKQREIIKFLEEALILNDANDKVGFNAVLNLVIRLALEMQINPQEFDIILNGLREVYMANLASKTRV